MSFKPRRTKLICGPYSNRRRRNFSTFIDIWRVAGQFMAVCKRRTLAVATERRKGERTYWGLVLDAGHNIPFRDERGLD